MADNRYGFISCGEVKKRSCVSVPHSSKLSWATTAMVSDARDHCASVMAANLALWAGAPGTARELALAAHRNIGNGPIVRGARAARRFLDSRGIRMKSKTCFGWKSVLRALRRGRPCALLVCAGIREWHWVLAVGAFVNKDGDIFLEIADGWNEQPSCFGKGAGSTLIFGAAFGQP